MRYRLAIAGLLFACAPMATPPSTGSGGDSGVSQLDVDAGGAAADAGGPVAITNGALTIAAEPSSPCAAWLPQSVPDAGTPPAGSWTSLYTDGAGDLAATYQIQPSNEYPDPYPVNIKFFPADGGAPIDRGADTEPIATSSGFIWPVTSHVCMMCDTNLFAWPSGKSIFVGNGYPWHGYCAWTPRPLGGIDAVCARAPFMTIPGSPPSLVQFDATLAETSSSPDLTYEPVVVAVDRLDHAVEAGSGGQRWIDATGSPLSDWFHADARGALALTGGGLVTKDDLMIPSGSSDVHPAPAWLKGRHGQGDIVLRARAYAFTEGACGARIYDSEGELCGTVSVSRCNSPLRFGPDGSLITATSDGGPQVWFRLLQ